MLQYVLWLGGFVMEGGGTVGAEAELAKSSRWGRPAGGARQGRQGAAGGARQAGAAGEFPAASWGICPTLRDGWLRHWLEWTLQIVQQQLYI